MKLYIPSIGEELTLSEPWTFTVYSERRNEKLGILLGLCYGHGLPYRDAWWKGQENSKHMHKGLDVVASGICIFPKGTILKVDRIYIRKGKKGEFDSLSFYIVSHPEKKEFKGKRFWAKLSDVNTMNINKYSLQNNDAA